MAPGGRGAGVAPRADEARGNVWRGAQWLRAGVRVVPPGGEGSARRAASKSAVRLRACLRRFDTGSDRRGWPLCARLGANASGNRGDPPTGCRPAGRMTKTWFVPPVVIPVLIGLGLAALIAFRALW